MNAAVQSLSLVGDTMISRSDVTFEGGGTPKIQIRPQDLLYGLSWRRIKSWIGSPREICPIPDSFGSKRRKIGIRAACEEEPRKKKNYRTTFAIGSFDVELKSSSMTFGSEMPISDSFRSKRRKIGIRAAASPGIEGGHITGRRHV